MYKVAYTTLSYPVQNGQGHTSRVLAIRAALVRAKLWGKIDFKVIGLLDNSDLWPTEDKDKYIDVSRFVPGGLANGGSSDTLALLYSLVINQVSNFEPDLLVNDNVMAQIWDLIKQYPELDETTNPPAIKMAVLPNRPAQVWHLQRYAPGLYRGAESGCIDRLYEHEFFQPDWWHADICTQKARSEGAKRDGEAYKYKPWKGHLLEPTMIDFPAWENADRTAYPTLTMWEIERDARLVQAIAESRQAWEVEHHTPDRKRIAPIVNLDTDKVLTPAKARKWLQAEYPDLDPKRPVCLVIGRSHKARAVDTSDFKAWHKSALEDANRQLEKQDKPLLQPVYVGEDCGPRIKSKVVPNIINYVPGADLVLAGAGYNTFYELRLLKQLGLWQGQAAFYAIRTERGLDQEWRALHQSKLFETEQGASVYPDGNGADEIAIQIGRKAGL